MSSTLSAVPIDRRRRAATMALGMGALLIVVGVLPWVLAAPASVRLLALVAGLGGLLFGLVGGGLVRSVRADTRPAAPYVCGCGHDHDPTELTVSDAEPAGAAAGAVACASGAACGSCGSVPGSPACATCLHR